MNQIYPDSGLVRILSRIANAYSGKLRYRLFSNNLTPGLTNVIGDFTEATFTGYAAQDVAAASFTSSSVGGHLGSLLAAPITFVCTASSQAIYGYYVTDFDSGDLLYCARFDSAPITITTTAPIQVVPILGDQSILSS